MRFSKLAAVIPMIVLASGCANNKMSDVSTSQNPLSGYGTGKVLYISVQKEYCNNIAPFVDECRIPKYMKNSDFHEEKRLYSVRIKETAIADTEYNPAGLLITLASIAVGGAAGQGMTIGNSSTFGAVKSKNNGKAGFIINEENIWECGSITKVEEFDNCRQQMLTAIKSWRTK